jgi:hypothetical protein
MLTTEKVNYLSSVVENVPGFTSLKVAPWPLALTVMVNELFDGCVSVPQLEATTGRAVETLPSPRRKAPLHSAAFQ